MTRTRTRAALALAALALAAGVQLLPRAAAAQKSRQGRVDARAVYAQHCARCHGRTGAADTEQGELYGAPALNDPGWWRKERPSNARLRRVIVHGGASMPPFEGRLNSAQVNALVAYVRTFKGK